LISKERVQPASGFLEAEKCHLVGGEQRQGPALAHVEESVRHQLAVLELEQKRDAGAAAKLRELVESDE